MLIPQRGRNISDQFRAVTARNIPKSFATLRMTTIGMLSLLAASVPVNT
jgi:hypothetical protein